MNRIASSILMLALAALVAAGAWRIIATKPSASTSEKPPPAANVSKVVKEDELNTVTLTEEAEHRLGLQLAAVTKKAARRVRVYGGEVTIPVGRAILVSAPLGGLLKPPASGLPKAGEALRAGQPVIQLLPLLTPDGRAQLSASLADADGQVNTAKATAELTRIALDRAKRVLKEGAGSQRMVDEAQAAFDVAAKALEAATTRRTILAKVVGDAEAGTASPLSITAPRDGLLRLVSALPGQTVPSGAALFEIVDLSTVWVRVALPVGEVDGINREEPAQVGKLSAPPGTKLTNAKPAVAPPSANPLSATVDLFYELPNADGRFTPGQRLGVSIPLAESQESSVVPWSAIVFDVNGGTWVYVRTASRTFARRRVTVQYTLGEDAVISSGPPVGAQVVTAGVQELFGAETGFIK
jgi:RND family efflux transporter MFP subunit